MAVGTPVLQWSGTGTSSPLTSSSLTITSGDVLLAHVAFSRSSGTVTGAFTMGGTLSGTWTLLSNSNRVWATRRHGSVYICTNPGTSGTVQVSHSGPVQELGMAVWSVSGVDTTTPTDGVVFSHETTTNQTSVTITSTGGTAASGDAMVAFAGLENNDANTLDADWTAELYDFGATGGLRRMVGMYDTAATLQTAGTFTWTNPGFWYAGIARLKAATGGGTDATVTPAAIAVTVNVGSPTVAAGSTVTPAAIGVTTDVPTPTLSADVLVTPSAIGVTVALGTAVGSTSSTVDTLSAVGVSVGVGVPTVEGSATVVPSAIAVQAGVPAVTVDTTDSANISPAAIGVVAGVPSPTLSTSITVSPSSIQIAADVPNVSVTGTSSITIVANAIRVAVGISTPAVNPVAAPSRQALFRRSRKRRPSRLWWR